MSNSLVRASLELFGYDDNLKKDKKKRRRNKTSGVLDLIPLNHRIIGKTAKRESINVVGSKKTSLCEVKRHLESKIDPTEKNVESLLLLSGNKLNYDTTDKLLKRARKKSRKQEKEVPIVPETTVFTEEDFEKFEREYCEL